MQSNYATYSETAVAKPVRGGARSYEIVDLFKNWGGLKPTWDEFVERHPKGSVFHMSDMLRVYQAAKGHRPLGLAAVRSDGQIIALLTAVRVQTLAGPLGRLSSRSIMYAEPLCDDTPESIEALAQLIARHDLVMERSVLFTEVRPIYAHGLERTALERCGYEYLEYLNYLVDVSRPPADIWNDFHHSAQRAVRRCKRHGVEVREVSPADALDQLYPLLKLSFDHSGIPLADRSLFEAANNELPTSGKLRYFAAYEGDAPMAMDALLIFKDRVYHWFAGLRRSIGSPCTLLRWHVFQWAHDNGYALCDLGGAGWPNIPYGVRDFKRKFGGELVQYGRYRKVYAPWKLALAEQAYKIRQSMFSQK